MAGRVPTGFATETYISEHTFRQGHRAIEGGNTKKRKREGKGDTSVVSGSGAYKGPWARYEEERPDAASDDEYGSDEEVEIVYETRLRKTRLQLRRSLPARITTTRKRKERRARSWVASSTTIKDGHTCMYLMVGSETTRRQDCANILQTWTSS
jgi:hypothetical protein